MTSKYYEEKHIKYQKKINNIIGGKKVLTKREYHICAFIFESSLEDIEKKLIKEMKNNN